jgi:pimeloyl-ACP methyl ester carboxylesterase
VSTIYLLPGMGADRNMYSGKWHLLPNSVFLNWPQYRGEKSIAEMARRIIHEQQITPGSIVIGSSLGGIVACEIGHQIKLKNLILIGSAKQKDEINSLLAVLHPLIDLTPLQFIQRAVSKIPNEIVQMFSQSEPEFIRAMCRAIFMWDGLNPDAGKPVRIHGAKDRVIPLPTGVQHVLNGGHLLAIKNADECIKIVQQVLATKS